MGSPSRFAALRWVSVLVLVGGLLAAVPLAAHAQEPIQHGITFTKGCVSPRHIGDMTQCAYSIRNNADDANDTLTISSIVDTVAQAGSPPPDVSGNLLPSLTLLFIPAAPDPGAPSCNGTQTVCTLPPGSRIVTSSALFHTITAADFASANPLNDTAILTWQDLCDQPSGNCNPNPPAVGAGSSTQIVKEPSLTATSVLDANDQTVTVVRAGTVVHDQATVSGIPGGPVPTGSVIFDFFTNGTCTPPPDSSTAAVPLDAGGVATTPPAFDKTLTPTGQYAFLAHYSGDDFYQPSDGPCEPVRAVDAQITISPDQTNRINDPHTFTVTLSKDVGDGNGFVAAPGEHVDVVLVDSNGAAHTAPSGSCTNAGANTDPAGQCTITFSSPTAGIVTGHATSTLPVAGLSITVATDGIAPNSPDAVKTFVDAKISIAPDKTNRVGAPHTFTATLLENTGDGNGYVPAAGEHIDVVLVDGNGAVHSAPTGTCTNAGANTDAAGQCEITFSSNTTGTVTGHASSTLLVGGVSISVNTDGIAPNSPDAVKTYVDAKITISPDQTNRVGDPHTFTVTLSKDLGDNNGFVAAAGEHVDVTLTDSNGASSVLDAGASTCDDAGANTDAAGQCTITFTSATGGKVTGHATSTLTINGVGIAVATDGIAPNSGDAVKTFVDAKITIEKDATNPVGAPHTFTVTLSKDTGDGNGFVAAPGEHVDVTLTDGGGATAILDAGASTCDDAGANTDAAGQCTMVFTSNSAGTVTGHATSTLSVGGVSITVATDGIAPNSGDAVKTFVAVKIAIAPDATNRVGEPHTFTVTLSKDTGGGFVPAAGEHVDFTLTDGNGASSVLDAGASTCDDAGANTDAAGQCTITFTSATTGTVTGHATSTLSIGGVSVTVATDGTAGNSVDAVKTFVDAKIAIEKDAINPVGAPHTFTVTLSKDTGDGNGFVAAAGEHVDFTLTDSGGASSVLDAASSTCDDAGANTDASGQCTIVFTSNSAGTVTGHATSTLSVGGVSITVATDGNAPNSGDAVKKFADDVVTTRVLDATNTEVTGTTVTAGTVVHDEATVAKTANTPAGVPDPTGTVSFTLFDNGTCNGAVVDTDPNVALNASGVATSKDFTTPAANASFSYLAHYNGDVNYPAHDGPCEPFTVEAAGGQGCTPGFWKQPQHFHFWVTYTQNQSFSSVFGVTITINTGGKNTVTDPTLLQALGATGGGINALARFAVQALLASSSLQSPDFTTAEVIAIVQAAVAPGPDQAARIEAAHQLLASAPGVVNDNCTGFITPS